MNAIPHNQMSDIGIYIPSRRRPENMAKMLLIREKYRKGI